MPFRRRRRSLLQATSTAVQHSDTKVSNAGPTLAPTQHVLLVTNNARTTDGSNQTIQDGSTTGETVDIGNQVKYLNIFMQVASRNQGTTIQDYTGWLEYAVVMNKESDTVIPVTQLGTKTLGDVATKMYRNETIWTGAIPVGKEQPNYGEVVIKVPRFKQKIRIGDEWSLYCYFRDLRATATEADSVRLITSTIYKSYR